MIAKSLKHKFQSAVVDAGTAGEISPNDWNDDHDLRLGGRTVTIATDTIVTGDELSLIKYNRATAIAVALAAPGGANFPSGWTTFLRNAGAGAVTITVTGATVNGGSTLALNTGDGATLFSDGTNYDAIVAAVAGGNVSNSGTPTVGQLAQWTDATHIQGIAAPFGQPQGRLTLQSLTPVMITTQSAKTTIYYTPYVGNLLPIYNGTSMVMTMFAELSVAITDTTKSPAAIGASKVNDWFVWSDAGTIRVGHGPDWTSDTVRSAGTALVMVNGILLNNASITNGPAASRGTYVGSTRSNASSQLDWILGAIASLGTAAWFGVWNCYNRVDVSTMVGDATANWTNSGTLRPSNGSTTMRASAVFGLAEDAITATFACPFSGVAGTVNATIGIGFDSTTTFIGEVALSGNSNIVTSTARYSSQQLGFHFWQAMENASGAGSGFFGQLAGSQNGLFFDARM